MTEQFNAPRSLSRRRFMVLTGIALSAGGLLAACQSAAPAASPAAPPTAAGAAPSKAAPVTTGASALKGTKLTIIGGNSYVPAQDGELDALVKQLSADTGMDAKIERFADAQMDAKVAAVIESGGADVAVLRDTALDDCRDFGIHLGVREPLDPGVHARIGAELLDQRVELAILGWYVRIAADDGQLGALERTGAGRDRGSLARCRSGSGWRCGRRRRRRSRLAGGQQPARAERDTRQDHEPAP